MRAHAGEEPVQLQVLYTTTGALRMFLSYIFGHNENLNYVVCNDKHIQTGIMVLRLSFCSAIRTHACEKPVQMQVLSECTYPTNIIVCNEKLIPTIQMVTSAQVLYCHANTYQ